MRWITSRTTRVNSMQIFSSYVIHNLNLTSLFKKETNSFCSCIKNWRPEVKQSVTRSINPPQELGTDTWEKAVSRTGRWQIYSRRRTTINSTSALGKSCEEILPRQRISPRSPCCIMARHPRTLYSPVTHSSPRWRKSLISIPYLKAP